MGVDASGMDGPAASRFTVATWNVRAAIGPGPFPAAWWRHVDGRRLQTIGDFVAGLRADVVALQEVAVLNVHGEATDVAASIATRAGFAWRFAAAGHFAVVEPESGRTIGSCLWGNAILTRLPLRSSHAVGLPIASDAAFVEPAGSDGPLAGILYRDAPIGSREPRCLLTCEVALSSGRAMTVATCHLTHVGRGQRLSQANAVAAELDTDAAPTLLLGDLNAPITASDLVPIVDGFMDAFAEVGIGPGDPTRATCGTLAIDHVLARGLTVASCRVATEAGDLSDHWPVTATLRA